MATICGIIEKILYDVHWTCCAVVVIALFSVLCVVFSMRYVRQN